MGFYIETPQSKFGKADILIDELQARSLVVPSFPPSEGEVLICVVSNPFFDAAGVCYDEREFEVFNYPDPRPKRWLSASCEKVAARCPDYAQYLRTRVD